MMLLLHKITRPGLQVVRTSSSSTPLRFVSRCNSTNNMNGTDYQEIGNAINSFLLCMDRNRSGDFAELFTDTGTCEIIKAGVLITGQESLKELCESLHTRFTPCLHMVCRLLNTFTRYSLTNLFTYSCVAYCSCSTHTKTLYSLYITI